MVSIHSFSGEIDAAEARVFFRISSAQEKAYRIEALHYRLEGVRSVSIHALSKETLL
jgi:hypothetical protein